ncbi:MAG TPA: 5,6-dimethylbenzimidazole synthase [Arenibaculum sp.]|nr:5,6-dimethylbenzimidazole synthase [Arenibaculum sp.]
MTGGIRVSPEEASSGGSSFDPAFRDEFERLLRWRRDVRRFRRDRLDPAVLRHLLDLACLAPSVGLSQPWRFVLVETPRARAEVRENFVHCNREALESYHGERARLYAGLKLAGLDEAPVHLAVFCDLGTPAGHGLGRRTMPEMLRYSVVTAVHTLWLAARAQGIGLGWVSILDPVRLARALDVPADWDLVAYLCLGYPEEEHTDPELARAGWERADPDARRVVGR